MPINIKYLKKKLNSRFYWEWGWGWRRASHMSEQALDEGEVERVTGEGARG